MRRTEQGAGSGPARGGRGVRGPLPDSGARSALGAYRSLLPALLVAACAGADAGPAAVVRDSAGVRIVENPASLAMRPLWTVAAEPAVEIGVLEGEEAYQLSQVGSARRLSDGRIVISNGGTHELRFFDAEGRHLATVGRKGGGPGEFEGLGPMFVGPGDTLAVYDWNLRRISFFEPRGGFVRSVTLEFPGGFPTPIGRLADGTWLCSRGFVFAPGRDGAEVVRDTLPLLVFDGTGVFRDSIGRFPAPEFYVRSEGRSAFAMSLPFGSTTEAAVWRDRFYAGHNARYEVVRYTPAASPELVIRLERAPVAVTKEDVDRLKAERLERASEQWRARNERMFQEIPFPSHHPAFADVTVDADGHLWVLDATRPGDDRRPWVVFSPDGQALGSVETPMGLRVLEIGRDHVVGVWLDELDVEHVRLHTLRRAP